MSPPPPLAGGEGIKRCVSTQDTDIHYVGNVAQDLGFQLAAFY